MGLLFSLSAVCLFSGGSFAPVGERFQKGVVLDAYFSLVRSSWASWAWIGFGFFGFYSSTT